MQANINESTQDKPDNAPAGENPNANGSADGYVPYVPPVSDAPLKEIAALQFADPFRWLARGWHDMMAAKGIAVFLGHGTGFRRGFPQQTRVRHVDSLGLPADWPVSGDGFV